MDWFSVLMIVAGVSISAVVLYDLIDVTPPKDGGRRRVSFRKTSRTSGGGIFADGGDSGGDGGGDGGGGGD